MKTCTKCGFSCASGCLFVVRDGKLICKKCAGVARREVLAEINAGQKEQKISLHAMTDMQANIVINPKKIRR